MIGRWLIRSPDLGATTLSIDIDDKNIDRQFETFADRVVDHELGGFPFRVTYYADTAVYAYDRDDEWHVHASRQASVEDVIEHLNEALFRQWRHGSPLLLYLT
jgi:hypothetical protein